MACATLGVFAFSSQIVRVENGLVFLATYIQASVYVKLACSGHYIICIGVDHKSIL
jgi:hypothetical protein